MADYEEYWLKHWFDYIEGTVLAERTNSRVVVGGTIRSDWRGHASGNISSHTIETQEFWLEQNNGQEVHINLGRRTVPIRQGHSVVIVMESFHLNRDRATA